MKPKKRHLVSNECQKNLRERNKLHIFPLTSDEAVLSSNLVDIVKLGSFLQGLH